MSSRQWMWWAGLGVIVAAVAALLLVVANDDTDGDDAGSTTPETTESVDTTPTTTERAPSTTGSETGGIDPVLAVSFPDRDGPDLLGVVERAAPVDADVAVLAGAAIDWLVNGPTGPEQEQGLTAPFPADLGDGIYADVTVNGGRATVELVLDDGSTWAPTSLEPDAAAALGASIDATVLAVAGIAEIDRICFEADTAGERCVASG